MSVIYITDPEDYLKIMKARILEAIYLTSKRIRNKAKLYIIAYTMCKEISEMLRQKNVVNVELVCEERNILDIKAYSIPPTIEAMKLSSTIEDLVNKIKYSRKKKIIKLFTYKDTLEFLKFVK